MLFRILLNFFKGYIDAEVEGYYIERFINTCKNKGIFLWRINRKGQAILELKIGINDFKIANEIANKHQCQLTKKKEKGIPIIIKKYKKRKMLFIPLILILIIIAVMSKFVWNIEVEGNETIDTNEIIETVNEYGLKLGKLKSRINTEKIISQVRKKRDDIAWIGIELKGTNAIIRVVEADKKPEIIDENDFCNIIASKDGIISKIVAQNGTAVVEEGDEVKKGDLLIAGWMEGEYTDRYYVNSKGEVKAIISYEQIEKIEKKEYKREQTGEKNKKYAIKFDKFKINFYKRLSKFEKYDTIDTNKKLILFKNFYLPIEIIKYTNYEVNEIEIEHNKEEAEMLGKEQCETKLNEMIKGEVLDKKSEIIEYDNYYNVIVKYDVLEDIGTKEKIEF